MRGKMNQAQPADCCGGQVFREQHAVHDPLCGAKVALNSSYRLEHGGRTHYYCSETCRDAHARLLRGVTVAGVTFACDMHPEFRDNLPGECPQCGMRLSPRMTSPASKGLLRSIFFGQR